MHILHIAPYYAPAMQFGGIVRALVDLSKEQARQGHQVTILTTDVLNDKERISPSEETPFRDEGLSLKVVRCRNLSAFLAASYQLYLPRGFSEKLKPLLKECDVLHCHGNRNFLNVIAASFAFRASVPIFFSPHGTIDLFETKLIGKRLFDFFFNTGFLQMVHQFTAVSPREEAELLAKGIAKERIQVIFNPVPPLPEPDREESNTLRRLLKAEEPERFLLCYIGRISHTKGLDFFLDVFKSVPFSATFVIAGNDMGGCKAGLIRKAEELHIGWSDHLPRDTTVKPADKQIIFAGFQNDAEKATLLYAMDGFVYPSVKEIFGIAPFEAIACGLPVCVSRQSGCGEMVRSAEAGYSADYGDVKGWEEALLHLCSAERKEERDRMLERGQRFIQRYLSLSAITAETVECYRKHLNDRRI